MFAVMGHIRRILIGTASLAAALPLLLLTRSTALHALALLVGVALYAGGRALADVAQVRKLRALRALLTQSRWSAGVDQGGRDPLESVMAACDQLFDRLADYHAERTATFDLLTRMLACRDRADLSRVLKRSLRKVFAQDSGAVYLPAAHGEPYEPALSWGSATDTAAATSLCFTIAIDEERHGLLSLQPHASSLDGDGQLLENKRLLAEIVARQIGLALTSVALRARLHTLSVRDGLTGLHNRRYFDEAGARELEVARRRQVPLSLVLLDVDHFKRFNDTHGHRAGDAALREVAQVLQATTRASDVLCRYGGEEFVLVMTGASAEQARMRVEAVLAAARVRPFSHEGVSLGPLTLSAGVAECLPGAADLASLVEAADRALYEAKRAGRDRACIAGDASLARAA
jgi:diguanylate cyclase (GGDEF)-like protein